jgi:hypothetical protein
MGKPVNIKDTADAVYAVNAVNAVNNTDVVDTVNNVVVTDVMDPVDVVYVLGTGSRWDNNEIRFSLRSMVQNLQNYRNVYVVGVLPPFLKNVIHVPVQDIFNPDYNADGNIIHKILQVCKQEGLSENFLFINDDHLIIKPMDAGAIPPYHKGCLTTYPESFFQINPWRKRLHRTMKVLLEHNYPTFHFDCHTPIVLNKTRFPEIMGLFDYTKDIGYTMKSLYANVSCEGGVLLENQKKTIFHAYNLQEINQRLAEPFFMSFNDDGLNTSLKWWLIDQFTNRSEYEKDGPQDLTFDLYNWVHSGQEYKSGVEVYAKYFKHKNLIELFRKNETQFLRDKLNFKLNQLIKTL